MKSLAFLSLIALTFPAIGSAAGKVPPIAPTAAEIQARIAEGWDVGTDGRYVKLDPDAQAEKRIKNWGMQVNAPYTRARNASECPRSVFPEKFGSVRNQGGLGWCFATVAADLLTLATGHRVSHFDLGLQFYKHLAYARKNGRDGKPLAANFSVNELWAGNMRDVLQIGLSINFCREGEVSSQDFMLRQVEANVGPLPPETSKHLIRAVIDNVEAVVGRNVEQLLQAPVETCEAFAAAKLLMPSLSTWQITAALSSARSKEEAFHWMLKLACERKPTPVPPTWAYHDYRKDADAPADAAFLPQVNDAMDLEQPVVLEFNAKRFHAFAAANPKVTEAPHAALLVGREFRDGQCRYLVRDSQGSGCAAFAPPYNNRRNCARGHYWITEEDFRDSVTAIGIAK